MDYLSSKDRDVLLSSLLRLKEESESNKVSYVSSSSDEFESMAESQSQTEKTDNDKLLMGKHSTLLTARRVGGSRHPSIKSRAHKRTKQRPGNNLPPNSKNPNLQPPS